MTLWPTVQFFPIVSESRDRYGRSIILHVRAFADLDPFIVAAQHRAEPDARRTQQAHLADHGRGVGDEEIAVGGQFGPLPVEFVDGHQNLLSDGDLGMMVGAFSSKAALQRNRGCSIDRERGKAAA